MRFIAFDLETTGTVPGVDQIVEIGAVRFVNGQPEAIFATLVDPLRPIPPGASAVNGISDDMVKGKIGEYRVSAAHYGSDNTAYIQVHLPDFQSEALNQYFVDFPEILTTNPTLIEHEKSYGLLNQKGGELEYTKYFTVIDSGDQNNDGVDDIDEFLILEEDYQKQFEDKSEYSYDQESGTMKWRDGDYESTLVISRDHGRIYLMLRKPLVN